MLTASVRRYGTSEDHRGRANHDDNARNALDRLGEHLLWLNQFHFTFTGSSPSVQHDDLR